MKRKILYPIIGIVIISIGGWMVSTYIKDLVIDFLPSNGLAKLLIGMGIIISGVLVFKTK